MIEHLQWMAAGSPARATVDKRRRQLRAYVAAVNPATATTDEIAHWLGAHRWAPATLHSNRAAVRGLHRWMATTGRRSDDPTIGLPRTRQPRYLPRPAAEETIADARARAAESSALLMIDLGALAGLRRAEIAGLRREDLQAAPGGPVLMVAGKGGGARLVPIGDALAAEIRTYPRGHLFPSDRHPSGHLDPDTVGRILSGLLGPGCAAHQLRHRYATRAYQGTHDLVAVQRLLGHATIATTQVYADTDLDSLRAAANAAG